MKRDRVSCFGSRWLLPSAGVRRRLRVSRQRHRGARARRRLHRQGRRRPRRSSTTSPAWRASAARASCSTRNLVFQTLRRSSAPATIPSRTTCRRIAAAVQRAAVSRGARTRRGRSTRRSSASPPTSTSFDRWTFAFGVFGPSVVRQQGVGHDGARCRRHDARRRRALRRRQGQPAHRSSRPVAAAVRVTHWLDVGVALHLVVGIFDLANVSFTDLGPTVCARTSSRPAATRRRTSSTTGFTATGALGADVPPAPQHRHRPQRAHADRPRHHGHRRRHAAAGGADPAPARTWPSSTPACRRWCASACATSSSAPTTSSTATSRSTAPGKGRTGPRATATRSSSRQLGPFSDIHPTLTHHYQDTFSVRLGGAYNMRLPAGVLTLRLGGYFDSAATKYKDTRVDFDTMAKYGRHGRPRLQRARRDAQRRLRVHLRARSQRHQRRHPVDQRRGQRLDADDRRARRRSSTTASTTRRTRSCRSACRSPGTSSSRRSASAPGSTTDRPRRRSTP